MEPKPNPQTSIVAGAQQLVDESRRETRRSASVRRKARRRLRDIDQPIVDLATHPTETVTPKVLAAYPPVDCDERTVIRMIENGALVGYKVGREWRITTASARVAFPAKPLCDSAA